MLFVALQVLIFSIIVDENLGCCAPGSWIPCPGDRESWRQESVHWAFGVCSKDEQTCLSEVYNGRNITQITGVQLATIHPSKFNIAPKKVLNILESLEYPSVKSMNCEELCKCLSCGHGYCSDRKDQDKCSGKEPGFICRCVNSPSYPNFNAILRNMLTTGMACRKCGDLKN